MRATKADIAWALVCTFLVAIVTLARPAGDFGAALFFGAMIVVILLPHDGRWGLLRLWGPLLLVIVGSGAWRAAYAGDPAALPVSIFAALIIFTTIMRVQESYRERKQPQTS